MDLSLFLLGWYVIGAVFMFATLASIDPVFCAKDLILVVVGGLYGPVSILWYLIYADQDWLDRPLFRVGK